MIKNFLKRRSIKRNSSIMAKQHSLLLSTTLEGYALNSRDSGVNTGNEQGITVSLTTIRERINDIHLTIESLFQQSVKARRIVLWLPSDKFTINDIPAVLKKQEARGLEIAFCKEDIGPYTKFYYCLQKYPDSLIATVDDDLIYPLDLLDQLYRGYCKNPNIIYCHRAHRILLDHKKNILPYKQWDWSIKDAVPDLRVFPTGVGGVLYFPGCFDDDILNKDRFLSLSPNQDDVWLKAMSLKKGVLCQHVDDIRNWKSRFIQVSNSQAVKLKRHNKSKKDGNDSKIAAVFGAYGLTELLID